MATAHCGDGSALGEKLKCAFAVFHAIVPTTTEQAIFIEVIEMSLAQAEDILPLHVVMGGVQQIRAARAEGCLKYFQEKRAISEYSKNAPLLQKGQQMVRHKITNAPLSKVKPTELHRIP